MKIFQTFIVEEGGGQIFTMDTIEHEEKLWLVPGWIEYPDAGYKVPERLICLDGLRYQTLRNNKADFAVNVPIPRAVLSDPALSLPATGYLVKMRPSGIRVDMPKGVH
jgi:hypothetical protein